MFLSLDRHLCWWTISHREYHPSSCKFYYHWIDTSAVGLLVTESHPSSCQFYYHWIDTSAVGLLVTESHPSSCQFYYHWIETAVGLLVTESVIHPVVSFTTTGSTPLLVDYQSQQVSFVQLSVFLSLDRHLCWWTISHREYHPSSCQSYYHWIDTSAGGLLVTDSIIRPVVNVTSAGSTPLLVDYQSQRVSFVQKSVLLSLNRHLCCWTISHREYHPSCCQCYYHWINTSAGGLLVTESIIRPVVSVSITGSTSLLVDYQSQRVSSVQQSVFLSLDRHLCWWTISHREYHPSSCQCYHRWFDTSAGGLLVTEINIRLVFNVTTTGSTPLLVDYQSQRISSVQLSVLLLLVRHLCWWTISHREYHPSCCQCYYHWIDTSTGGLLVTESITRPVVNVTITGSTPQLLD